MTPLEVSCESDIFGDPTVQFREKNITVTTMLSCKLYETNQKTDITRFKVTADYVVRPIPKLWSVDIWLESIDFRSITWDQLAQFPIKNQALANNYVKSALPLLANREVFGSNFTQPTRANPKVIITDTYIYLYE